MRRYMKVTNNETTTRRHFNGLRQILAQGLNDFLIDQEERAFRAAIALEIIEDFELNMSDPLDAERLEELVDLRIEAIEDAGRYDYCYDDGFAFG